METRLFQSAMSQLTVSQQRSGSLAREEGRSRRLNQWFDLGGVAKVVIEAGDSSLVEMQSMVKSGAFWAAIATSSIAVF
jgi:hypothetical protein